MPKDASEVILETLAAVGVKQIFGIPGDAINGLVDAVRRQDVIEFVTVRHEEAGAFAAAAQAKLTGTLGVVAGTAGPGAIHLLNGLYDAKIDGAPVLAITGQVETANLGSSYHQEIDLQALFQEVAEFSETLVNPDQMPELIRSAVRSALTNRTVSHFVLPADMANATVKRTVETPILPPPSTGRPTVGDLSKAAKALNDADSPTILLGIGGSKAVDEVIEIAETLGAPIIKSLRAKDLIPDSHPLVIGGTGLLGTEPAVNAMDRTDLLFMVGTDFPYKDFYPTDARTIQLDIDPTTIGRRTPVHCGLVGDAEQTLIELRPMLVAREEKPHLEEARADMENWTERMNEIENDPSTPIRPQRVAAEISKHTKPGAIYLCDTGAVTVWGARNLKMKQGDRFTLSSGLASMAFALPAAIGAQFAYPDRQVVALTGDGGFSMLMGDLITAVSYKLPITVVIFNNSKLGLIKMEQEAEGLPEFATSLDNPDFAEVARSIGAKGWRVEDPEELEVAISSAIAHDGPSVVDAVVNPNEITMPPRIEAEFAFGYAKAKVKEMAGLGSSEPGVAPLSELVRRAIGRL